MHSFCLFLFTNDNARQVFANRVFSFCLVLSKYALSIQLTVCKLLKKILGNNEKSLSTDSVCLEECQKQLRSLYQTSSKVRIIPWDQNSAVHIDKIYTDLSWVMDDRTPSGVIQENLDHYTDIFAQREPRSAPKRILVYGQPGTEHRSDISKTYSL